MPKLPTPSREKELPAGLINDKEVPAELNLDKEAPVEIELDKEQPTETPKLTVIPAESPQKETQPEPSPEKEEKPSDLIEENCVMVGDKKIELKPTKLKYFRNKAASAYGIIKAAPIQELLTCGKGVFDDKRDADQLLYDFLVAAFNDRDFVRDNYDEMDPEIIDQVCKIFGRINHIDEKEEAARKNREAQAQAKR